jgi:hypothetical protein
MSNTVIIIAENVSHNEILAILESYAVVISSYRRFRSAYRVLSSKVKQSKKNYLFFLERVAVEDVTYVFPKRR